MKILRQLIPAFKPGARLIINDTILPEPNTLSELHERKIRALDMVMLSFFNSRERERDDWERICQQVDSRLKFVDAWVPEGAALGIIEAVWDDDKAMDVAIVKGVDKVQRVNDEVNMVNGANKIDEVIEVNEVSEINGELIVRPNTGDGVFGR